jgi:hypothetical protein
VKMLPAGTTTLQIKNTEHQAALRMGSALGKFARVRPRALNVSEIHGGRYACINSLHNAPFGSGRHDRGLGCSRRPYDGVRQRHHRLGRESGRRRHANGQPWRHHALHGSAFHEHGPRRDVRRGQFDRAALPAVSGAAAGRPDHVEGSRRRGGSRRGAGDHR